MKASADQGADSEQKLFPVFYAARRAAAPAPQIPAAKAGAAPGGPSTAMDCDDGNQAPGSGGGCCE